eukprot:5865927-Alexandrium_andersonii.AAC.1
MSHATAQRCNMLLPASAADTDASPTPTVVVPRHSPSLLVRHTRDCSCPRGQQGHKTTRTPHRPKTRHDRLQNTNLTHVAAQVLKLRAWAQKCGARALKLATRASIFDLKPCSTF